MPEDESTAEVTEQLAATTVDENAAAAALEDSAESSDAFGLLEFTEARRASVQKAYDEACAGAARLDIKKTHALLFSAEEKVR